MRRSIHEIILGTFNIRDELQRLDTLFYVKKTVPISINTGYCMVTMFSFVNDCFNMWPFTGTCIDLAEYVKKLNADNDYYRLDFDFSSIDFENEELLEIAFGNVEFYYNMHKFIKYIMDSNIEFCSHEGDFDLGLFRKMGSVLDIVIDHINAKAVELEPHKYIIIPNNEEVIAAAECVENLETSKIILKYNHFKTKGDLEAKKSILRHLFIDIEKKGARSVPMDDFCFILNEADIRHNNSGKKGKSITTGMTEDQIEEVYDVAYRLYLMAKLDKEYKDIIKSQVTEYKNRLL